MTGAIVLKRIRSLTLFFKTQWVFGQAKANDDLKELGWFPVKELTKHDAAGNNCERTPRSGKHFIK